MAVSSNGAISQKALFIPLKGEYFDAFASGTKETEYRAHGPRWNRGTCQVGRDVVLSRGYGKARRLLGRIIGTEIIPRRRASEVFRKLYPAALECIAIHIEVSR